MGLLNLDQTQTTIGITTHMTTIDTTKNPNQPAFDLIEVAPTDKRGNVCR
jgi:hypothetical protein